MVRVSVSTPAECQAMHARVRDAAMRLPLSMDRAEDAVRRAIALERVVYPRTTPGCHLGVYLAAALDDAELAGVAQDLTRQVEFRARQRAMRAAGEGAAADH